MEEFKSTYKVFKSAVDAVAEEPYDKFLGWVMLDKEYRAPALYVTFYDEVTLAYSKIHNMYPFVEEELAISTLMQYLMKNVPMMMDHPKRFSGAYAYKVAYNCMYSLGQKKKDSDYYYKCHESSLEYDVERRSQLDRDRFDDNEFFEEYGFSSVLVDDMDVLDRVVLRDSMQFLKSILKLWPDAEDAIDMMIHGYSGKRNKQSKYRKSVDAYVDMLRQGLQIKFWDHVVDVYDD